MDRDELVHILCAEGVFPHAYNLSGAAPSETYILRPEGDSWSVFYSERGLESGNRVVSSEAEACEHLLSLLRMDHSGRDRRRDHPPH